MRSANFGFALGHLILPLGQHQIDSRFLREALKETVDDWADRKKRPRVARSAALTTILGQSDQLLSVAVDDFRFIADFQSRLHDPSAQAFCWVFAVPYLARHGSRAEAAAISSLPPPFERDDEGALFVIYLRVRRSVYRRLGAAGEHSILATLKAILDSAPGIINPHLHYSLSWPDLLISGGIDATPASLLDTLLAIQNATVVADGESILAIQRTLTMFGLPVEDLLPSSDEATPLPFTSNRTASSLPSPPTDRPSLPDARLVVFLRNQPGYFPNALHAITRIIAQPDHPPGIFSLDGTWDALLVGPEASVSSLRDYLRRLIDARHDLLSAGVERIHTHLLVREWRTGTTSPHTPPSSAGIACECSTVTIFDTVRNALDAADAQRQLPRSLAATSANYLAIFRFVCHDKSACCDTVPALRAHTQGLARLLTALDQEYTRIRAASSTAAVTQHYANINRIHQHLEVWCLLTGRVLRERTAGSFERLFFQTDSVASLRGGLQKLLFVAERLMDEFADRLPFMRSSEAASVTPRFAAIYEPRTTPAAHSLLGLINIPVRHAFSLHLLTPQLCHEVGQHVFALRYEVAAVGNSLLDQRVSVVLQERRGGAADAAAANPTPSSEAVRANFVDIYSDMYADLLVFLFAFRGDYAAFLRYLTTLVIENAKGRREFATVYQSDLTTLLVRLFHVLQFSTVLVEMTTRSSRIEGSGLLRLCEDVAERFETHAYGQLLELVGSVKELVFHATGKYAGEAVPSDSLGEARINVRSPEYKQFYLAFMNDLLGELNVDSSWRAYWRTAPALDSQAVADLEDGLVTSLATDAEILDYFLDLYRRELDARIRPHPDSQAARQPSFKQMAALGRSAILEFYRRQAL